MQVAHIVLQKSTGQLSFSALLERGSVTYQGDGGVERTQLPPAGLSDTDIVSCKVATSDGAGINLDGQAWRNIVHGRCLDEFFVLACCVPYLARELCVLAANGQPYWRTVVTRHAGYEPAVAYTNWPDRAVVRESIREKELAGRLTWESPERKGEALDIEGVPTPCTLAEIACEMVQELDPILSRRVLDAIKAVAQDPLANMAEFSDATTLWLDAFKPQAPKEARRQERIERAA